MALKTTDLILPPSTQAEILKQASNSSAFLKIAKSIDLPGSGTVLYSVGKSSFEVVAEEGIKPAADAVASSKLVRAHNFAGIVLLSKQLVTDKRAILDAIIEQAPSGIGESADRYIAGTAGPLADFDNYASAPEHAVTDYASLIAGFKRAGKATHVVASESFRWTLAGLTTPDGRPLYDFTSERLYNLPIVWTDLPGDFAIVGDFSKTVAGVVDGIDYLVSEEATVTKGAETINLFQTNQVAVRIEARIGYRNAGSGTFVKLVPAIAAG